MLHHLCPLKLRVTFMVPGIKKIYLGLIYLWSYNNPHNWRLTSKKTKTIFYWFLYLIVESCYLCKADIQIFTLPLMEVSPIYNKYTFTFTAWTLCCSKLSYQQQHKQKQQIKTVKWPKEANQELNQITVELMRCGVTSTIQI